MPSVIKVLIKGLNKVMEFPSNTALPDIEKAIKVNWSQVEEMSGLPMDTASRMARAEHLGFDTERVIFSGTFGDAAKEIVPYGERRSGGNLFGGVFGSFDEDVALGHGDTLQRFVTKNHASHDDFRHAVFYDDADSAIADSRFRDILSEHKDSSNITNDEVDELLDFTMGEKHIEQIEPDMGFERFNEIMGVDLKAGDFERLSDQGWDFQGLKGELARRMDYDSVGMPDEHGESVLVLTARAITDQFNPQKIKKASALASAGAVAATLAPGVSAAQTLAQTSFIEKMLEDRSLESLPSFTATRAPFIDQSKIPAQFRPEVGGLKGGNPSVPIALSQAARVLDKVEVPVIGKPFEGVADYLRNFGFDDSNKERFKRAVFAALDVI